MVYIAYFTKLNLQICVYAQKRCIWRENCKYDKDVGVLAESLHLVIDQWIQYKLGKQYLWKKVTQPWESNPGPTPIRGELATIIVSVGLKKLVAIRHYIQVG